jgi:hypothetical protein
MVVFIFTGCGKKDGGGDTSLEGTWRITKVIETEKEFENGIETYSDTDTTEYPFAEKDEDSGLAMIFQPYYQLKNNKLTQIAKVKVEGIPDEVLDEIRKNYPIIDDLIKGLFVKKEAIYSYSVSGDKLIFNYEEEEDEEDEEYTEVFTYNIKGKNMVMIYNDVDDLSEDGSYYSESEDIINLVKVSDSEVASEKYYDESDLEFLFGDD